MIPLCSKGAADTARQRSCKRIGEDGGWWRYGVAGYSGAEGLGLSKSVLAWTGGPSVDVAACDKSLMTKLLSI
jgi:hypothetical protein